MSDLEAALLDEVGSILAGWRTEYADDPEREREELLLLALEREQIAAVAYREEAVVGRVDALDLAPEIRALIRQTLVRIWKDEELHTAISAACCSAVAAAEQAGPLAGSRGWSSTGASSRASSPDG